MGSVEGEHILVTTVREQFAAAESQRDPYVKDSTSTPSVAPYASREEAKRLLQALVASKQGSVTKQASTSGSKKSFPVAKQGVAHMGIADILVTKVREQFVAVESTPDPYVKLPTLTQA